MVFLSISNDNANFIEGAENEHWLNLNAFAARLTNSQVLDLSLYAIWAMREALETHLEDVKPAVRDETLRAAALWVEFCGQRLYSMETIWESGPRKGDVARGGPLYSGPTGFCKARWELWRERFDLLSQDERLQERTRETLKDAANKINASLIS